MSAMPAVLSTNTASNRRVPLSALPNANNNTLPPSCAHASGLKRARSHAGEQRELPYSQNPPAKRLMIDGDGQASSRVLPVRRANTGARQTALQKKLVAMQVTKQTQNGPEKAQQLQKPVDESLDSIRQWQRHYKKAFPQFVFYFESIPEEQRVRVSRQVLSLGSREEKFFSKAITHVITVRPIPHESDSAVSSRGRQAVTSQDASTNSRTIDPSLLNRGTENQAPGQNSKGKLVAEFAQAKKAKASVAGHGDILLKAREMGIKIWALEKLERMMHTMFDTDTGEQPSLLPYSRSGTERGGARVDMEADLCKMIKQERAHGHGDRDYGSAMHDMVQFRGYYVYVHDLNERVKPIMIRDYPKVAAKEDGKWPQFRLSAPGKCPFVEDVNHLKRLELEDRLREKKKEEQRQAKAEKNEPAPAAENNKVVASQSGRMPKDVSHNVCRKRAHEPANQEEKDDPSVELSTQDSKKSDKFDTVPLFGSAQANVRNVPRFAGGEPIASGVQPSNVTSAIRSQMISSTAAAPASRAAATKGVSHLNRRVLEKAGTATDGKLRLSYLTNIRAALNSDKTGPATRAGKRKGQEKGLIRIHDDNEDEPVQQQQQHNHNHHQPPPPSGLQGKEASAASTEAEKRRSNLRAQRERERAKVEKELRPGYCENCREKFDDFDQHVVGRKHRKFATSKENWTELDDLLKLLVRS